MSLPDAVNYAMNEIMIEEVVEVVEDKDVDNGLILDSSSSFDVILNKKIDEINELYELKTKNKKMISNVNEINFMDKKLYNKINAAIDKKYKESKQYKKKCEDEVQNAL
jgi:hypothetical protein